MTNMTKLEGKYALGVNVRTPKGENIDIKFANHRYLDKYFRQVSEEEIRECMFAWHAVVAGALPQKNAHFGTNTMFNKEHSINHVFVKDEHGKKILKIKPFEQNGIVTVKYDNYNGHASYIMTPTNNYGYVVAKTFMKKCENMTVIDGGVAYRVTNCTRDSAWAGYSITGCFLTVPGLEAFYNWKRVKVNTYPWKINDGIIVNKKTGETVIFSTRMNDIHFCTDKTMIDKPVRSWGKACKTFSTNADKSDYRNGSRQLKIDRNGVVRYIFGDSSVYVDINTMEKVPYSTFSGAWYE